MRSLLEGSSPHTWRSLNYEKHKEYVVKDHLHIRGDHSIPPFCRRPSRGSSPHTWRSLYQQEKLSSSYRIISTYVEITTSRWSKWDEVKDHLHIRGDHKQSTNLYQTFLGSSPHTWRSQHQNKNYKIVNRIISTYVEITFMLDLVL